MRKKITAQLTVGTGQVGCVEDGAPTAADAQAVVRAHMRENSGKNSFCHLTGNIFKTENCGRYWSVRVRNWATNSTEFVVNKFSGQITEAYECAWGGSRVRRERVLEP